MTTFRAAHKKTTKSLNKQLKAEKKASEDTIKSLTKQLKEMTKKRDDLFTKYRDCKAEVEQLKDENQTLKALQTIPLRRPSSAGYGTSESTPEFRRRQSIRSSRRQDREQAKNQKQPDGRLI